MGIVEDRQIFDKFERLQRGKKVEEISYDNIVTISSQKIHARKRSKGVRRMPWLRQAMKDAVSCEKGRGSANTN